MSQMGALRGCSILIAFFALIGGLITSSQAQVPEEQIVWSVQDMDKTLFKNIQFHGPFCNELVTMTVERLPAHDFVEVSFDLLIMAAWDGSIPVAAEALQPTPLGPDYIRVAMAGGPILVYGTFSNVPVADGGFRPASKMQTYPSQVPGKKLRPQSGAAEANTLGYTYPFPGPPQPIPMDAIYPIKFVIPHHEARAVLEVGGLNLQNKTDENWGIANFQMRALTAMQATKPSADEIASAFFKSLSGEPRELSTAFQTLIAGMDDSAAWIEANVKPVSINSNRVEELIKALAGKPDEEAAANTELKAIGHAIEPYLRDSQRTATGQQRRDIDWILESLGVTPIPLESVGVEQVMIATRALEVIGTPKALAVRRKLTAG